MCIQVIKTKQIYKYNRKSTQSLYYFSRNSTIMYGAQKSKVRKSCKKQAVFHYSLTLTLLLTQEVKLLMLLKYLHFVQDHKMQALLTPDILIGKLGSCHRQ